MQGDTHTRLKSCDRPEQCAANSEDRIVADALAVNRRPGMFRLQTFPSHKGIRVYLVILGFNVNRTGCASFRRIFLSIKNYPVTV